MKELIRKCLEANKYDGDIEKMIEWAVKDILEKTHNDTGIYIELEKGFCYAFLDGKNLILWEMYNESGDLNSHREVFEKLKEFGRRHGVEKMIISINIFRYEGAMRLYKDLNPKIRAVVLDIDLQKKELV
jgi:hypothetical protein